jgi:hypothetical protein
MKTIIEGLRELPAGIFLLAMKYADPSHDAHKEAWERESDNPVDDGLIWVLTDEGRAFWSLVNSGKYQEALELLRNQKPAPDTAPDLFQTVKAAVKEALVEREHSGPTAHRVLTEDELERVGVTHTLTGIKGWINDNGFDLPAKIYYLGKCATDGDIFMERTERYISIYKGHLNAP